MLQFVAKNTDRYSILEAAQMAIEGGCGWIEASLDKTEGDYRDTLLSLMDLCRESETILTLRHDVELVKELKIHGIHLFSEDIPPSEVRIELGPHAIIGVDVKTIDDVFSLQGIDIDYVTLRDIHPSKGFEYFKNFISSLREAGIKIPVVARGDISLNDIVMLKGAGINGVALSDSILCADDPVAQTKAYIDLLQQ